ncbi:MAG: leucine-rich repeat protein, partial [Vulcanibacillus sp.]
MNKKWIVCLFLFFSLFLSGCDLISSAPTGEQFIVTFEVNGGAIVTSVQVNKGSTIILPSTTKDGFTFAGWFADEALSGTPLSQLTIISDITLYAKWTPTFTNLITITFDSNGGSTIEPIQVETDSIVSAPSAPIKNDYLFMGWFLDTELTQVFSFETPVQTNIILYAKWEPLSANMFTIQFVTNGGTYVSPIHVEANILASEPTPPTKSDFQFGGWYLDNQLSQPFSFTTFIQENITLYAKWIQLNVPLCTIQFITDGGSFISPIQVPINSIANAPTPPTKAKHQFLGWYLDTEFLYQFDFNDPITTHITLYARWSNPIIESFLVTFETNGGDPIQDQYIIENYLLTKPIPTKLGYEFVNWYQDDQLTILFDFDQTITQAYTLYAKWNPVVYTIQFDSNGGNIIENQSYFYNDPILLPSPTKAGYEFENWYQDESLTIPFIQTVMGNESYILYANWVTPISDFQYSSSNDEITILSYQGSATEVTIPNTIDDKPVKFLAEQAFANDNSIEKIVVNNQMTTIGNQAFANMLSLKELILPNNVNQIGELILSQTNSLQLFQLSSELSHSLSYYLGVDAPLFNQSFVVKFSKGGTSIHPAIFHSFMGEAILELADDHSSTLADNLFQNNQYISHLRIPEGISIVSSYAFANMPLLKTIILPNSLVEIGQSIFSNDPMLETITIPFIGKTRTSVNTEGNIGYLFSKTSYTGSYKILQFNGSTYDPTYQKGITSYISTSLKTINITDASIIPYGALHNVTSLEELTLNDGIVEIGRYALSATGLSFIEIPNSVTIIDRYCFANSALLENATFKTESQLNKIDNYAFYKCILLDLVFLPDELTTIGDHSFAYCSNLRTLFIPNSATKISSLAFKETNNLTIYTPVNQKPLDWPNLSQPIVFDIESIHTNEQFLYAKAIDFIIILQSAINEDLTHLIIPSHVDSLPVIAIASYAFYQNENLQNLSFEDNSTLEYIGNYAFSDCNNLEVSGFPSTLIEFGEASFAYTALSSLTIDSNLEWIGHSAFEGSLLTSLTFSPNSHLEGIGENAFDGTLLSSVVLPKSVTSIGYRAFSFMPNLTSFAFETDSLLNYIDGYTFYKSDKLTSITIPASVSEIGMGAFAFISALSSCEFEEGSQLVFIHPMAFANTAIEQITIPGSVQLIDDQAFMNCSNLHSVTFLSNQVIQRIGISAFENCSALQSINLPDALELLAGRAFKNCTSLQNIILPSGLTAINSDTFMGANLTAVHIPNTITQIFPNAFVGNSNLCTLTFESNSSLVQIDDYAFSGSNIKEVVLPKSLQIIGSNIIKPALEKLSFEEGSIISEITSLAFYNNPNLKEINLPSSVTHIGFNAFSCIARTLIDSTYNYEMTRVFIPKSVIKIREFAFVNLMNVTIFVEEGAITTDWETKWDARTADYFKEVLTIQPVYYNYKETVFHGDYEIAKCTDAGYIIGMNPASNQTNLLIPATIDSLPIKAITSNAFINNNEIESVLFDENSSVKTIGINAFKNNSSLRFVFFPNSLISIGAEAFRGCTSIRHIYIPASVQEEALTAFNDIPNFFKYSAPDISAMHYNDEFVYYLNENEQAIIVDVLTPALQKNLIIPATVDQFVVGG